MKSPAVARPFPAVVLILGALALGAVSTSPVAAKSKCFPREGNCIVVTLNGQPAVKLTKKDRRQLQPYSGRPYVDDALTWIAQPIHGEIEIETDIANGGTEWFGPGLQAEASVVPLEEVSLETNRKIGTAPSVRIGGEAVLTERLELESNRLPPGPYLLRVTLRGADNWDRATLFFRVVE